MIDQKYIDAFKSGIRKGPFKNKDKWVFDIDNQQLFIDAFQQAYLDASRTFRGINNSPNKNEVFIKYAQKVQDYFIDSNEDFDSWHNEWCKGFMKDLRGYSAKYGQAQKILNMMMKYLYCCRNAIIKSDVFNNAHMPLDTYTLQWYKREILSKENSNSSNIFSIKEWSNLDESTYRYIQVEIKKHLANTNTLLEQDFIIWPDENLIFLIQNLSNFTGEYLDCQYPKHDNDIIAENIYALERLIPLLKDKYILMEN